MTTDEFTQSAVAHASAPSGGVALSPLVILILPIVVPFVCLWLLGHLLDMLWESLVKGHKITRATVLTLCVRPAIRRAMDEKRVETLTAGEWKELEDRAIDGAVAARKSVTDAEWKELRALTRSD